MITIHRIRRIARAVAHRMGGGSEVEELVEARLTSTPFATRRKAVRAYLDSIQFLYRKRLTHAPAYGV